MDDISVDAFVDVFSQLIDRLETDVVPYAVNLIAKLLQSFQQLQEYIQSYMKQYPTEFESMGYTSEEFINILNNIKNTKNANKDRIDTRTEEQQKQDFEKFGERYATAVQCVKTIHTVCFAASALPQLFSKLEELVRPLIQTFYKNYFFYQHYVDEILELISTLIHYSEPPSQFVWALCDRVLEGWSAYYHDKYNQTAQIACAYIEQSIKFNVKLDSFMGNDMIDTMFTILFEAINDDYADPLFIAVVFDSLFTSYKDKNLCNLDKYIPLVLDVCETQLETREDFNQFKSAIIHVIACVIYYDPVLFLRYCVTVDQKNANNPNNNNNNQNNNNNKNNNDNIPPGHFYKLMNTMKEFCHDATWPAQRACVFGLSSIFTITPAQIPPTLQNDAYLQQLRQLLDLVTELVLFINYNEGEEDTDDEDDNNSDNENAGEDTPDESTSQTPHHQNGNGNGNGNGNPESSEADNNDDDGGDDDGDDDDNKSTTMVDDVDDEDDAFCRLGDDGKVLNLDANQDYVRGSDIRYMRQCLDLEQSEIAMNEIIQQWDGDNSGTVPNTPLDHQNEVMFFKQCVDKLNNDAFRKVLQDWNANMNQKNKKLLEKYLQDGQQGIEDMKRRQNDLEKEKVQRKDAAIRAAQDAQTRLQQQQQQQQQQAQMQQQIQMQQQAQQQMQNGR